jgi:hypothetical protein
LGASKITKAPVIAKSDGVTQQSFNDVLSITLAFFEKIDSANALNFPEAEKSLPSIHD